MPHLQIPLMVESRFMCAAIAIFREKKFGAAETEFVISKPITRDTGVSLKLAARLGLEPRQNESESFVLPLHHRAEIFLAGVEGRCVPKRAANEFACALRSQRA